MSPPLWPPGGSRGHITAVQAPTLAAEPDLLESLDALTREADTLADHLEGDIDPTLAARLRTARVVSGGGSWLRDPALSAVHDAAPADARDVWDRLAARRAALDGRVTRLGGR